MKLPSNGSRPSAKRFWVLLTLAALIVAGGFGYAFWNQKTTVEAKATSQSVTTKAVRKGSISLTTSGNVTLVPSQEKALAFTVSGTVARLNAAAGDQVKKGQVLAQLDNLETLQADTKSAEQDLLSAQQNLAAFKAKADSNIANARLQVIEAQKAVEESESNVVQKDWARCDKDTKDTLLDRYNRVVMKLNSLGDGGGNADYTLNTLLPQKKMIDQAWGAYQACLGYTDYQVASSQINLSVANAKLKLAQENLDTLTQNNGLDTTQLATVEYKVATAQDALDMAKDNLYGATLKAPFDGTILSVAGKVGDSVEVTTRNPEVTFVTIADLAHPLLQFTVDETDMTMVAAQEEAVVTFDAFPNRTFKGTVTRVDPALSTNDGISSVTGQIQLDLSRVKDLPTFPKSLSGSVIITQASAENVLLVPVEVLHQGSDGTYIVYVLGADGQPVQKAVEVGLSDVASAEIKSGLNVGEMVITSPVE